MVPVGGAIIAGFDKELIDNIGQTYPGRLSFICHCGSFLPLRDFHPLCISGRASATPSIDLMITLLSLGASGFKDLLRQRKDNYQYLKEEVSKVAVKFGERVLTTPQNPISIGKLVSCMSA